MITRYEKIFDIIFYQGFFILFIINTILLWNQPVTLTIYYMFYIFNNILNEILKLLIKQPRPKNYQKNLETFSFDYKGIHEYGMPSGHSQSSFFSLVFLTLVLKSPFIFLIEFIICLLTIYQRWKNKKHTIQQLFIGSIIGSFIAYCAYSTVIDKNLIL